MLTETKRVLVVDDDPGILESFNYMLQDKCELILSENGQDALRFLETEKPRLVFLDIKMPDISGLQVLEAIRRKYPELSVVIITGTEDEKNMQVARSYGVKGYLKKPLDISEIIEIVDSTT